MDSVSLQWVNILNQIGPECFWGDLITFVCVGHERDRTLRQTKGSCPPVVLWVHTAF